MERFELFIKKAMDLRKKFILNFAIIEAVLVGFGLFFVSNQYDTRFFELGILLLIIAVILFIGFRKVNNDILYCHEYYKIDRIQVIRKLKLNNPFVIMILLIADRNHLKWHLLKAHEAILYVNKYKERVEVGPFVIDTDIERNKNFKNEEECKQFLEDAYCLNFYKQTNQLNQELKKILNQLGVNSNYPIEILYEEVKNDHVEYEVSYKVYGFLVNYTTFYLDEEEYQKYELDNQTMILLDDFNFESIKDDSDAYFELKVNIALPWLDNKN